MKDEIPHHSSPALKINSAESVPIRVSRDPFDHFAIATSYAPIS